MSALPPKADMVRHDRDVRFVPKADIGSLAIFALFDYLVCNRKHARRNCKTECFCGFEVDDQFKFSGCLHRQVSRLVAFEQAPSVDASLMIGLGKTAAVADQTAG
jgi:hypothetical protein